MLKCQKSVKAFPSLASVATGNNFCFVLFMIFRLKSGIYLSSIYFSKRFKLTFLANKSDNTVQSINLTGISWCRVDSVLNYISTCLTYSWHLWPVPWSFKDSNEFSFSVTFCKNMESDLSVQNTFSPKKHLLLFNVIMKRRESVKRLKRRKSPLSLFMYKVDGGR